jgi:hypothetical protein
MNNNNKGEVRGGGGGEELVIIRGVPLSYHLLELPYIWDKWTEEDLDRLTWKERERVFLWISQKHKLLEDFYERKIFDFDKRDEVRRIEGRGGE